MGGLWKFAAMSAVIGVGLTAVWQAQQGMRSPPTTPIEETRSASETTPEGAVLSAPDPSPVAATPSESPLSVPFSNVSLFEGHPASSSSTDKPIQSTPEYPAAQAPQTIAQENSAEGELRYQRRGQPERDFPAEASRDSVTVSPDAPDPLPFAHNDDPFGLTSDMSQTVAKEAAETAPALPNLATSDTINNAKVRTAHAALDEFDPQVTVTPVGAEMQAPPNLPTADDATDPFADSAPLPLPSDAPRAASPSSKTRTQRAAPFPDPLPALSTPEPSAPEFAIPDRDEPAHDESARVSTQRRSAVKGQTQEPGEPSPLKFPAETQEASEPDDDPFGPAPLAFPADEPAPLLPGDSKSNASTSETVPADLPADAPPVLTPRGRSPRPAEHQEPAPRRLPVDPLKGDGQITSDAPRGIQEPRLTIQKVAPPKAVLGQELVYAVIVKNVGGSPASQVTVEDRIPKGARLVGTAPRAELIDKRLVWKLGTLQPNEERKIAIKVIPEEEGPLGSVAKVNFVSEVAAEIVVTAPQLKLRTTAPAEVKLGDKVELLFTLTNTGNGDAKNVILRSLLPEGLRHPSGHDLEYVVGDLPAGQSRDIPLELTAAKIGQVQHKATATADGNVTVESEIFLTIYGEQLVLTRKNPSRAFVGKPTVVSNQIGNEGDRPVSRVKVTEVVPAGFEFVEASRGGRYDPQARTITWMVGPVAPGEEQEVSATLLPKSTGRFEGTITATGATGTVATVKASLAVEGVPALTIEPLDDQRVVALGETITTQIRLRNRGTAQAQRVGLTIVVPEELRVVSAKGPSAHEVVGQRVLFDPVAELAPRDTATYELELEAIAEGDTRLDLQIYAEHLRRPVRHEEVLQVVQQTP